MLFEGIVHILDGPSVFAISPCVYLQKSRLLLCFYEEAAPCEVIGSQYEACESSKCTQPDHPRRLHAVPHSDHLCTAS